MSVRGLLQEKGTLYQAFQIVAFLTLLNFLFVQASHLTCVPCEPGTYCFQDASYSCPAHSTSAFRSDNITDCICLPGYYENNSDSHAAHTCVQCEANSYCVNGQMYSCPANAVSLPTSDAVTSCKCARGYVGNITQVNDTCTACEAGTYKAVEGASSCVPCLAGTFSTVVGSDAAANCVSCPPFSTSANASGSAEACACEPGYERNSSVLDLTCVACSVGYYNDNLNATCQACPFDSYADQEAMVTCTLCPVNSGHKLTAQSSILSCECNVGSFGNLESIQAVCTCDAGYELRNGTCVACAAGFYKAQPGNAPLCSPCPLGTYAQNNASMNCTSCEENSFQDVTGQTECKPCRNHSVSAGGSTGALDCECLEGYYYCAGCQQCKPCHTGFYKESIGNVACVSCDAGFSTDLGGSNGSEACELCPANSYIHTDVEGNRVCTSCPANSTSPNASEGLLACVCQAGFTISNGNCELCAIGTYKPGTGSDPCTVCPDGYIGLVDSWGTEAYNPVDISSACLQCAANYYTFNLSLCANCPLYSTSPAGSNDIADCECWQGFTLENENTCSPCAPGTYKNTTGSAACTLCPVNTYQPKMNATSGADCIRCPDNSVSESGSDFEHTCQCQRGYTVVNAQNSTCIPCAGGSYKDTIGSAACTSCADGTYYNGVEPYTSNQCTLCPSNTQQVSAGVGIESCVCAAGYIKENNACRECQGGFYCPTQTQEVQCYHAATSPPASDGVEDCACVPGYYTNCTNHSLSSCPYSCLLCPVNFFCPGAESPPQACPGNSSTLTHPGATDISACVCNAGWYESNEINNSSGPASEKTCVRCAADSYCVNDTITSCPANSTALVGTGSVAQCYCDAYFQRNAVNECELCSLHLVCEGVQTMVVDGVTILMPGNVSVCASGAVNVNQRCVCADGFYCNDGSSNASCAELGELGVSQCNACPYGSFCANNMLFSCGENKTSSPNSSHPDHCVCKPGYYLAYSGEEEQCLQCPLGAYCENEVLAWCSDDDALLTTLAPGQSSRDTGCLCQAGFFRLYKNDTCKPCPSNFYCPLENETGLPNVVACPYNHLCVNGVVQEINCAALNRTANQEQSACVCDAGFEENKLGECTACREGYTKRSRGDHACIPCNESNYYVNNTTCAPCGMHEISSGDFLSCICQAPYVRGNPGECVPCPVDHYYTYSFWDAGVCLPCPLHTSTGGKSNQTGLGSCECVEGYISTNNSNESVSCVSCPSGFYAENNECKSCGDNAVTLPGSFASSDCFCNTSLCQQFVWGDTCSGSCEVSPEPCSPCAAGHFKDHISTHENLETCSMCPPNQYQPATGQSACELCHPTRVNNNQGSSSANDCKCKNGYEPNGNLSTISCTPCEPGHYKEDIGNFVCELCGVGYFADAYGMATCISCLMQNLTRKAETTLSMGSTHVDNCTCAAGKMLQVTSEICTPCQQGSYKSSAGTHACRLCGEDLPHYVEHDTHDQINSYGEGGDGATSLSHCRNCPAFSGQDPFLVTYDDPMRDLTDCVCFPAHDSFDNATGCRHCANSTQEWKQYLVKAHYGNDACALCSAGKYFVAHNAECQVCNLHDADNCSNLHHSIVLNYMNHSLPWGTSFEDCDCALGSYRQGDVCRACEVGKFRNDSFNRLCQPCGQNEYQDARGQTKCKSCPANSYAETEQNTQVTQCLCEGGFEWDEDVQMCVPCEAGTSKERGSAQCVSCPVGTYSFAQASTCTSCGPNERSEIGSTSPEACNCLPGFGANNANVSNTSICEMCANGTFSEGGDSNMQRPPCTPCPANKTSSQGSTERAACKCIPGHGDPHNNANEDASCTPCLNGFYAPGGNNTACYSCGFGAITDPPQAAHAFSCCQCDSNRGLIVTDPY